jgi:antimicrobial peptide system SdpA family protein
MRKYNYIILFSILTLVFFIVLAQVLLMSLPFNPAKTMLGFERLTKGIAPQGWAFFTRNAREAQVVLYEIQSNNELVLVSQKHTDPSNLFGLKRTATKLILEMQSIRANVPDDWFENSEWNFQAGITNSLPAQTHIVKNGIADPILCGKYLLVLQDYVPWAWSSNMNNLKMPAKLISLHIQCN